MSDTTGMIAEIQRFSTGDGPGIRSTVFCKGCNLHCEWCHNPETISSKIQYMFYKNLCVGCGRCKEVSDENKKSVCPSGARKICGFEATPESMAKTLLEDKPFYISSGGGVTFSGGEPLLQSDFILETAVCLKSHGIHIIVDTALNVDYGKAEKLNPYTDCYFVDLKGVDEEECRKKTGADLKLIIENIKRLINDGKDVVIRIPIIPNYSDSIEYMKKASEITRNLGVKQINLIPFHNYGAVKYDALVIKYLYKNVNPLPREELYKLLTLFDNVPFVNVPFDKVSIEF